MELTGIRIMGITSSPSGGLHKHCLFFSYQTCNFNNSKVIRSIQLLDKQPLLGNHMLVLYSNTIAQLLSILPNHRQRDCPCCHCTCLCHRRKGTTQAQTGIKALQSPNTGMRETAHDPRGQGTTPGTLRRTSGAREVKKSLEKEGLHR